jgi:FMN phosphatase YigB (HAD superfamily)
MGDVCKPEHEAFAKVLAAALPSAEREGGRGEGPPYDDVVFFEDSFKNLLAAKELGMKTVLIHSETTMAEEGRNEEHYKEVDAVVPRLTLPVVREAAPFLWE